MLTWHQLSPHALTHVIKTPSRSFGSTFFHNLFDDVFFAAHSTYFPVSASSTRIDSTFDTRRSMVTHNTISTNLFVKNRFMLVYLAIVKNKDTPTANAHCPLTLKTLEAIASKPSKPLKYKLLLLILCFCIIAFYFNKNR